MGIKEGLEIVIFKHYSHIEIESDSIVALTLVQENSNAKLKYLLDECRSLISVGFLLGFFFLSFVVLPILGRIVLFALYFILLSLFLSWSRIFYF